MGVASLIIGVWAVFLGFIPILNYAAVMPALVGLVFGAFELFKLKDTPKSKGLPIAGTALNSIALLSVLAWTLIFSMGFSEIKDATGFRNLDRNFSQYFNYDFFNDKSEKEEEAFEKINPFANRSNPFAEENPKRNRPKQNKPYFKKEFKSDEPGLFHWRFERRYHSDNMEDFQKERKNFIEEMHKDIQKYFRSNVPKEFQEGFASPKPHEKQKKNEKDSKQKKPVSPEQIKKRYREVI